MTHLRSSMASILRDLRDRLKWQFLRREDRTLQRGQVLPIFAFMSFVLLGGAAMLTDVAWWWANEQRMQRAADAGALAGAIHLPGNQAAAYSKALQETAKNGYITGQDGVTVTPKRDPGDPRKLIVDIDGPVRTFFARALCWEGGPCLDKVPVSVTGAASFVLPVPMGSPENYYGVFGKLRTPDGGETTYASGDTGWLDFTTAKGSNNWSQVSNVTVSDDNWAWSNNDGERQQWGITSSIAFPANLSSVTGIEIGVEASKTSGSNCNIYARLSWNDGSSWSSQMTVPGSGSLTASDPADPYYVVGGTTDGWGRSWSANDFLSSRFRIRLENQSPSSCDGRTQVDHLRVKVYYRTSTFTPDANINDPYDQPLVPRGLWGTFINQGAEKINGDAYLPKWDPRTSRSNAEYDPDTYYNYAVEIPAGGSGELHIYDPVFCATSGSGRYGTGDRWFNNSNATSAYYTLYDTNNTPYIYADDTMVKDSGSLFEDIRASDESLGGPNLGPAGASTDCSVGATSNQNDGRYWHNRWWKMASGLTGGRTYRLHVRSTDPDNASAMNNANGHNSFSLWSKSSSGTPRIYGLGAMEAFTPLDPAGEATFYLSQIDAEHAGKTMVIKLWDPGDTGSLPASLRILKPTVSGYAETNFNYSAERVANNATSCDNNRGLNVSEVVTNSGGSSRFNGCWLTIEIPLPIDYDAPHPASEDPSVEGGWWKIRYVMGGNSSDAPAFDLTTWQVELRGNPVHLVLE